MILPSSTLTFLLNINDSINDSQLFQLLGVEEALITQVTTNNQLLTTFENGKKKDSNQDLNTKRFRKSPSNELLDDTYKDKIDETETFITIYSIFISLKKTSFDTNTRTEIKTQNPKYDA